MPLRGDGAALARVGRKLTALVTPGSPERYRLVEASTNAVKQVIREQFAHGVDPAGNAQTPRKDGKPGLQSKKLARGAVAVSFAGDRIFGYAKNRAWGPILDAHQEGHVFPPGKSRQFRGAKGRLINRGRYDMIAQNSTYRHVGVEGDYTNIIRRSESGKTSTRASMTVVSRGQRVLSPRPIYPAGGSTLTPRWDERIARFVTAATIKTLVPVKK